MNKFKGFRASPEICKMLKEIRKREGYSSESFTIIKAIEAFYKRELPQPKPQKIDLTVLEKLIGKDLYTKHIEFLKRFQKQDEPLEDTFKAFIQAQGINPTKEELLKRIQGGEQRSFRPLEASPCYYRTITANGVWYCDLKKIPPEVCINRQRRFLSLNRQCKPQTTKKTQQKGRSISIPQRTYCYVKKENVSIRETCYSQKNPCPKTKYCRSLDYYKTQLKKARSRGLI